MKEELTRRDIRILWNSIQIILNYIKEPKNNDEIPFKFAYGIGKNRQTLEPEIKLIEESLKVSSLQEDIDKINEFEQKRLDLNMEYCERDPNRRPIINFDPVSGQQFYVIPKDKIEQFNEDLDKIRGSYKDVLDRKESVDKKFDEIMSEKVSIELYKINVDLIPNIQLFTSLSETLLPIIE